MTSNALIQKLLSFQEIIQKTYLNLTRYKSTDLFSDKHLRSCQQSIEKIEREISLLLQSISTQQESISASDVIAKLQSINNDISTLMKVYGSFSFLDFINVCLGNNVDRNSVIKSLDFWRFEILLQHFHCLEYKIVQSSGSADSPPLGENSTWVESLQIDCSEVQSHSPSYNLKSFLFKTCGLKLLLTHSLNGKKILITGVIDNVMLFPVYTSHPFIEKTKTQLINGLPTNFDLIKTDIFDMYLQSWSLKDFLISKNLAVYEKFLQFLTFSKSQKKKHLSTIVKEFMSKDLFEKRNFIIQLFIDKNEIENMFMGTLLFELLSCEHVGTMLPFQPHNSSSPSSSSNNTKNNFGSMTENIDKSVHFGDPFEESAKNILIDSYEQNVLYESLPYFIQKNLNHTSYSMNQIVNNTTNYDCTKIPYENLIMLMKTDDLVKEKALVKLKEIRAKSDDSAAKARHFLDGLLKIPFQVYKHEPILTLMAEIKFSVRDLIPTCSLSMPEIKQWLKESQPMKPPQNESLRKWITSGDKQHLLKNIDLVNQFLKQQNQQPFGDKKSKKAELKQYLEMIVSSVDCNSLQNYLVQKNLYPPAVTDPVMQTINEKIKSIELYMESVRSTLDEAVHGHNNAKKNFERIIGQWIHGEQTGNCIGLEGPPGVGKTSIVKYGLSKCLIDENGESRPFTMIAIGGDANGSTLHGHNYTYVGSTWGSIVQILMDKKCMNPIILIDEVDKISKSEHGKELIGILTHLLDPTQNDTFQDKFFSGVDLDLSKVLFVLSYNDPSAIDKVLMDRIHRIHFSSLTLNEKLVIAKNYLLPEIFKTFGLHPSSILFSDDVLAHIIDNYTAEAGCRKLKEKLYDIIGEINVMFLQNRNVDISIPYEVTIASLKTTFFKNVHTYRHKTIHPEPQIGVINCLWANSLGQGGILPSHAFLVPMTKFLDLCLTGLLDNMMKESFEVAKSLAWSLTPESKQTELKQVYAVPNNLHGIHIHCGDGSIQKSGTSAGIAITILIYSVINQRKINNTFAVTGEANLDGSVNEIGALSNKILGGIKSGVTHFLYPKENSQDFEEFWEIYKDNKIVEGIQFHPISTILEALDLILV